MMHNQPQRWMRIVDGRVFKHLLVSITIAKTGNRSATDELMNAHWLAGLVVHKNVFCRLDQHRTGVSQFKFREARLAYDLLRRNSIDLFRPDSHKVSAASGNNKRLEAVDS